MSRTHLLWLVIPLLGGLTLAGCSKSASTGGHEGHDHSAHSHAEDENPVKFKEGSGLQLSAETSAAHAATSGEFAVFFGSQNALALVQHGNLIVGDVAAAYCIAKHATNQAAKSTTDAASAKQTTGDILRSHAADLLHDGVRHIRKSIFCVFRASD